MVTVTLRIQARVENVADSSAKRKRRYRQAAELDDFGSDRCDCGRCGRERGINRGRRGRGRGCGYGRDSGRR